MTLTIGNRTVKLLSANKVVVEEIQNVAFIEVTERCMYIYIRLHTNADYLSHIIPNEAGLYVKVVR